MIKYIVNCGSCISTLYTVYKVVCSDDKGILLFSGNMFQQMICIIIMRNMICITWFVKQTDCNVIILPLTHIKQGEMRL